MPLSVGPPENRPGSPKGSFREQGASTGPSPGVRSVVPKRNQSHTTPDVRKRTRPTSVVHSDRLRTSSATIAGSCTLFSKRSKDFRRLWETPFVWVGSDVDPLCVPSGSGGPGRTGPSVDTDTVVPGLDGRRGNVPSFIR